MQEAAGAPHLGNVAVQGARANSLRELRGQLVRVVLRVAEDYRPPCTHDQCVTTEAPQKTPANKAGMTSEWSLGKASVCVVARPRRRRALQQSGAPPGAWRGP